MFNIDDLEDKIETFDTKKLCAIIVTAKYFGNNIDIIRLCMNHLAIRRINGDNFNFESYITEEYNKLPQLSNNKFDLNEVMKNFRKAL